MTRTPHQDTGRVPTEVTLQAEATWRHSSYSQGSDQTCVDVAITEVSVLVRDSKDPDGPVLRFSWLEWEVFLIATRDGEFDLPTP